MAYRIKSESLAGTVEVPPEEPDKPQASQQRQTHQMGEAFRWPHTQPDDRPLCIPEPGDDSPLVDDDVPFDFAEWAGDLTVGASTTTRGVPAHYTPIDLTANKKFLEDQRSDPLRHTNFRPCKIEELRTLFSHGDPNRIDVGDTVCRTVQPHSHGKVTSFDVQNRILTRVWVRFGQRVMPYQPSELHRVIFTDGKP